MAGLLDFNNPQTVGLLSAGLGLLNASGPSRMPVSFGQALAQGGMQGLGAYQQTQAANQARALQQAQLDQLKLNTQLLQGKVDFFNGTDQQNPTASLPTESISSVGPSMFMPQTPSVGQPQTAGALPLVPGFDQRLSKAAALGWLSPGYVSAVAKQYEAKTPRAGAPVVALNPATGKMEVQFFSPKLPEGATLGANGQVGVTPGYGQTVTQLSSIPNLSAPMQTIKTSDQRELQLTQPEYIRYTQSGGTVLPSRYKGLGIAGATFSDSGSAQPAQPAAPAPTQPAAASGPAVVGATQNQAEAIQQAADTAAAKTTATGLAQRKLEQPKDTTLLEDAVSKTDQAIDAAKSVLNHPGLSMATGATYLLGKIPGTKAFDAAQSLETLKGQIMLSVLQAMRSASANGSSGFGQLSNAEGEVLRNSLVSLQQAQTTPAVKTALKNVIDTLQASRERMIRGYTRLYNEAPQIKAYHTNPNVPAGSSGPSSGFKVLGVER